MPKPNPTADAMCAFIADETRTTADVIRALTAVPDGVFFEALDGPTQPGRDKLHGLFDQHGV